MSTLECLLVKVRAEDWNTRRSWRLLIVLCPLLTMSRSENRRKALKEEVNRLKTDVEQLATRARAILESLSPVAMGPKRQHRRTCLAHQLSIIVQRWPLVICKAVHSQTRDKTWPLLCSQPLILRHNSETSHPWLVIYVQVRSHQLNQRTRWAMSCRLAVLLIRVMLLAMVEVILHFVSQSWAAILSLIQDLWSHKTFVISLTPTSCARNKSMKDANSEASMRCKKIVGRLAAAKIHRKNLVEEASKTNAANRTQRNQKTRKYARIWPGCSSTRSIWRRK